MSRTKLAGYVLMLIIFAVGIGVGIMVAGLPAPTGDILSLAGALIGASIAVFGAVLTVEWLRLIELNEQKRMIIDLVEQVQAWSKRVRAPEVAEDQVPIVEALTNADFLIEAIARAKEARQWVKPTSVAMVTAFGHIERMTFNKEELRAEARANVMYGGMPAMKQLAPLDARIDAALEQLRL